MSGSAADVWKDSRFTMPVFLQAGVSEFWKPVSDTAHAEPTDSSHADRSSAAASGCNRQEHKMHMSRIRPPPTQDKPVSDDSIIFGFQSY